MSRSRNIKPGFFKNPELVELPYEYRLLFIGLWTLADREGYLEDRPKRIKMELFPGDNADVEGGLTALEKNGFIHRYTVDGNGYIHILHFLEHQHPHHLERPSKIPKSGISLGLFDVDNKQEPRQDLDKTRCNPSDSLIPDSLNLIPDSGKKRSRKSRELPLPDDFGISQRVRDWAAEKGFSNLPERLEHFVSKCRAKGYTYIDWDEGFMGSIRDDWAGLNKLRANEQKQTSRQKTMAGFVLKDNPTEKLVTGEIVQ